MDPRGAASEYQFPAFLLAVIGGAVAIGCVLGTCVAMAINGGSIINLMIR